MKIDTNKQIFGEEGRGKISIGPDGKGLAFKAILSGSKTHNWPSAIAAAEDSTTVTVTGAAVGDPVIGVSMTDWTNANSGLSMWGYVSAADTVTVNLSNQSVSTIDLNSSTLTVVVLDLM